MKHPVLCTLLASVVCLLLASAPAWAQREFDNWYFGQRVGLAFSSAGVQLLTDGVMVSGEGCASISDSQGNLLFYTNGIYAWNRLHRRLANGNNLGSSQDSLRTETFPNSATQGVTIVPKPGSTTQYYIFTVDAAENNLRGGLRYAVVDMARQGGLGEVISKAVPVPVPLRDGRLTEKLVAVRHANQQDIWLVVHGWNGSEFLSYLLTPAGLAATPVISAVGSVHYGGGNPRQDYNALGCMKISPNGRQLAVARYNTGPLELFDFNYGTGLVSKTRALPLVPGSAFPYLAQYGVEFSPDNNLLYVSAASGLYQYNIPTGALLKLSGWSLWTLQLGPDQKIYGSFYGLTRIGAITSPNTPGLGCNFQDNAVPWLAVGYGRCLGGLPNVLVRPPAPSQPLVSFGLLSEAVCLGEVVSCTASLYPLLPDATVTWNFGEPTAGASNLASGRTVQHQYARAGTYLITMTVQEVGGPTHTYTQSVMVLPPTIARLAVSKPLLCFGDVATLNVTPTQPAGTTYRWQDGSTNLPLIVRTSGRYWVEVTAPQACPVRDSVQLTFLPIPAATLGPDQTLCEDQRLVLSPGPTQPTGTTYRWQDGSTGPVFVAERPGTYSVVVTSAAGCTAQGQVRVRFGEDCPYTIPNVITPNGDQYNEAFVLKGLEPGSCDLQIFNRWGRQVYQQAHYANNWTAAGQSPGVYYYLLVQPATGRRFRGWVEVQ